MASPYTSNYGTTMLLSQDRRRFVNTSRVLWWDCEREGSDKGGWITRIRGYVTAMKGIVLAEYLSDSAGETAFRSLTTALIDSSIGGFQWLPDDPVDGITVQAEPKEDDPFGG